MRPLDERPRAAQLRAGRRPAAVTVAHALSIVATVLAVVGVVGVGRWINHWHVAQNGLRPHVEAGDAAGWQDLYELLHTGNVDLVRGLALVAAACLLGFVVHVVRQRAQRTSQPSSADDSDHQRA